MQPMQKHHHHVASSALSAPDYSNDAIVTETQENPPGLYQVRSDDELLPGEDGEDGEDGEEAGASRHRRSHMRRRFEADPDGGAQMGRRDERLHYKVYKRRWFGMLQLTLLNMMVSWDWLSFSPVSTTAGQYYGVSSTAINWLSTSFLFAFIVVAPGTIWVLNRWGPRGAILVSSAFLLAGNWIRYAGTVSNTFGVVCSGQILTGLAQPFVLSAPTRYSDLWFTENGRVTATALMTLANPFGGALGQLVGPFLANEPSDIPTMVLYITIIATVATIPSFFTPAKPPTPPSQSSATLKLPLIASLKTLLKSSAFLMILIPFAVLVGLFNSISSLLNQMLEPFGFSETAAGIAGAILIVVGLVSAAITSPIIDRYKFYLTSIKFFVPLVGLSFLAFVWAPPSQSFAAVYIILAICGAASFSLTPLALEYVCEITYPVSPEVTSTICWSGGQLLGGIFILVSDNLTDGPEGGAGGKTPFNMQRALWMQAVLALAVVPLPSALGCCGRRVRNRRQEAERFGDGVIDDNNRDLEDGPL